MSPELAARWKVRLAGLVRLLAHGSRTTDQVLEALAMAARADREAGLSVPTLEELGALVDESTRVMRGHIDRGRQEPQPMSAELLAVAEPQIRAAINREDPS